MVEIYRLILKAGSDNFWGAAIQDVIKKLQKANVEIVIYEPTLNECTYNGIKIESNIKKFKAVSDVVVANRLSDNILDIKQKVYTRDIYNSDI